MQAPSAGARPATPLPGEPDPSAVGERERALLCGPGPSLAGAATLDAVLHLVRDDERSFQAKAAEAARASDAECPAAADALDAAFERLAASSRSLCDYQAARGVGASGEQLASKSAGLRAAIDRRVEALASADGPTCRVELDGLTSELEGWLAERDRTCALTPQQAAVRRCGVESSDPSRGQHARRYCDALAAGAEPSSSLERPVQQCIEGELRRVAAPKLAAPSPATTRAADSDDRLPFAPGLQTALLGGAADFFAERAEQELSLFAYDVVSDRLCRSRELEPFLPSTCPLLDSEETLAPPPSVLRAAARADFDALPRALVAQLRPSDAALACTTALAWSFGEVAADGVDLLDLLGAPAPVLDAPLVKDHACPQGVRDRIASVARELAKLLDDRPRLERAVKAGQLERALSGGASTRTLSGELNDYGRVLRDVLLRVRHLDRAIVAWEKNPSAENRAAAVSAGLRSLDPVVRFAIEREESLEPAARARAAEHLRRSIELTGHILNHEYAAAVIAASQLGAASGVASGASPHRLGLVASLAQAESSDDVRNVLNEAALPLGSWRRKNEPRWGATLTGLVGVQLAREIVVEAAPRPGAGAARPRVEAGPSLAPSLILGADLHHGLGRGVRAGLQLSLLDLGALLTFRMDDPALDAASDGAASDATERVDDGPELRVEQVFSPGLYPYLGWGPLDVGVGASFVPALRSLDTPDDTRALDVLRLGVFIAVDVSVLPLL